MSERAKLIFIVDGQVKTVQYSPFVPIVGDEIVIPEIGEEIYKVSKIRRIYLHGLDVEVHMYDVKENVLRFQQMLGDHLSRYAN